MKSTNLNIAALKLVFKKLLLILGLIAVFASIAQQSFDDGITDSLPNSQSTVVQLDKDNSRDNGDAVARLETLCCQYSETGTIYHFYSASYQEPTLLVQQRPPNA